MLLHNRALCLEHIELLESPTPSPSITPASSNPNQHVPKTRSASVAPSPPSHAALSDSSDLSISRVSSDEESPPPVNTSSSKKGKSVCRRVTVSIPGSGPTATLSFEASPSPTSGRSIGSDFSLNVPRDDSDSENLPMIPKPEGEAGRPRRGGYNLEEQLKWDDKFMKQVKSFVKQAVVDKLDPLIPWTGQPSEKLQEIRDHAMNKFPRLRQYEDCWAVDDLMRCLLKYQRQKTLQGEKQRAVDRDSKRRARRERKVLEDLQTKAGESSRTTHP
ncbi:hypothetical protein PM082_007173 [Marasmius tenuissimus]|nr:hypothetical protein PM082_007173 [Marasmius tenuissimus]